MTALSPSITKTVQDNSILRSYDSFTNPLSKGLIVLISSTTSGKLSIRCKIEKHYRDTDVYDMNYDFTLDIPNNKYQFTIPRNANSYYLYFSCVGKADVTFQYGEVLYYQEAIAKDLSLPLDKNGALLVSIAKGCMDIDISMGDTMVVHGSALVPLLTNSNGILYTNAINYTILTSTDYNIIGDIVYNNYRWRFTNDAYMVTSKPIVINPWNNTTFEYIIENVSDGSWGISTEKESYCFVAKSNNIIINGSPSPINFVTMPKKYHICYQPAGVMVYSCENEGEIIELCRTKAQSYLPTLNLYFHNTLKDMIVVSARYI